MRYKETDLPDHIREQLSGSKNSNNSKPSVAVANVVDDTKDMNKTERRFYEHLRAQSDIVSIDFNAWRCRLANGAWYKPDFFVIRDSGQVEIYEVKGFWRSRDRVRTKVAASKYPYFSWYGAQWEKGQWKFERF